MRPSVTFLLLVSIQIFVAFHYTNANTEQLTQSNIDNVLEQSELVVINFYADWCHFSQMLKPIFEEMAGHIKKKHPPEKVTLGTVDCIQEGALASRYQISKYPTLKIFRFGQPTKREYRGQRSVESLSNYIEDQLRDPIVRVSDNNELKTLDNNKPNVVGYFDSESSLDFVTFHKVSSILREECSFHAAMGSVSENERITGNKVVFRAPKEDHSELTYPGLLSDYPTLIQWMTDRCSPVVREITFQNAEELTEEGLPFVILFHHPDDKETPELMRKQVVLELLTEKQSVNFLTADGSKFTHPLHHLGKTTSDLPILAIDSFQHMYLWKQDPKTDISKPGLLKQFIADLHSGKLHREFHNGPDPTDVNPNDQSAVASSDPDPSHYNVEHKIVMDSNGVRVQIMRVVKIGHQDSNPTLDFGAEIENLFRAISGVHNGALQLSENPDPSKNPAEAFDAKSDSDNFVMNLVDGDKSSDDTKQEEINSEGTTTIMKTMHKINIDKVDGQHKSSAPPRSIFAHLAPSRDRYTLLKEEL